MRDISGFRSIADDRSGGCGIALNGMVEVELWSTIVKIHFVEEEEEEEEEGGKGETDFEENSMV